MLNEQKIRQSVDNRLSGLTASEARRMRIRAAVNQERREATPVRNKKTLIIAIALIVAMLTSAIAVAEGLNLFDFFGKQDERYARLAPEATLNITEPALISHPYLGDVEVKIDSAYFDGLGLSMAYRIDNATCAMEYTPTAEEIAQMQPTENDEVFTSHGDFLILPKGFSQEDIAEFYTEEDAAQISEQSTVWNPVEYEEIKTAIMALLKNDPAVEIIAGYNAAVLSGSSYGYKRYNVYVSDHTYTDDGIDIEPESAWEEFDGTTLCEMMNFRVPLDEPLRSRDTLTVTKKVYQQESTVWFDGKECWISRERKDIGTIIATIPKAKDAVKTFTGTGSINGVECTFAAEVSPLAAVLTLECPMPIEEAFPINAPEGTDRFDQWREMGLVDQQGREYGAQWGMQYIDEHHASVTFEGTGELPESLTAYAYSVWESSEWPVLTKLDGVTLTETK